VHSKSSAWGIVFITLLIASRYITSLHAQAVLP
jgi:hypothetical protein